MYRLKALEDRQVLIEEIYDELEAILLGGQGCAEEEDLGEIEQRDSFGKSMSESLSFMGTDISTLNDAQKKRYFSKLLEELLEKKALLEKSLVRLDDLIEANAV